MLMGLVTIEIYGVHDQFNYVLSDRSKSVFSEFDGVIENVFYKRENKAGRLRDYLYFRGISMGAFKYYISKFGSGLSQNSCNTEAGEKGWGSLLNY